MTKKVVQINATCGVGSTGKICVDISNALMEANIENYILYGSKSNGYELGISCASKSYTKLQSLKSRLLGNYGFNSQFETKRIIKFLDKINPNIVHLHNIHGHDCNLEILFNYFKRKRIKIIWTFHDCWAFTGYCTHFMMEKCNKWEYECSKCVQKRKYSFFLDRSRENYLRKKEAFSNLDLTIITPSKWLENIVKKSFLNEHRVITINNGIDLDIFKPTESTFREKYNIYKDKKIVLGVAFDWGLSKGLDVFIELSNIIDNNKYQIVLVGTNNILEKQLSSNIISIHRTQNQNELAEIYSAADVFVNPTREDTFPTVNLEALACGTPVVTFGTGGSPECISNECGSVVEVDDIPSLIYWIEYWSRCNGNSIRDKCVEQAKLFNKAIKYKEYLDIYNNCMRE